MGAQVLAAPGKTTPLEPICLTSSGSRQMGSVGLSVESEPAALSLPQYLLGPRAGRLGQGSVPSSSYPDAMDGSIPEQREWAAEQGN